MRAHRRDCGASTIEYAGLIVLAALILGSLTALGIPGTLRDGLAPTLCKIVGGTSCGGYTAGGPNTGSGRPSDRNTPPGSNRSPVATGKDPGLLPSLGQSLGHYWHGFENFAGFDLWRRAPHGWYRNQTPFNDVGGVVRELWEQAKGIGSFAKMAWCATGLCPHAAVKEARDGWSYIFHHPGEALKQAGYSIIEPCIKTYRAPNQNESSYWYARCATSLITSVVGVKGLGKLGKLSKLGKAGKAAEEAGKLSKAARAADDALKQARDARKAAKGKNLAPGNTQKIIAAYRGLSPAEKAKFLDKLSPQELADLWGRSDAATRSDILQNASKQTLARWKPPEPNFSGNTRWKQFRGKLFNGKPSASDLAQGRIGDCYCLAAMGAVADRAPGIIRKMIKVNPNGTYTVTFGDGTKTTVTGLLPERGAQVAKSGWAPILEKALAQRYGGYDKIAKGGRPDDPLSKITGKPSKVYGGTKPSVSELSSRFRKGTAYVVGIKSGANLPNAAARRITFGHAYTVVGINKAKGTITLANPHGNGAPAVTLTEKELRDSHIEIFESPTR